jgi:hypothetical protein
MGRTNVSGRIKGANSPLAAAATDLDLYYLHRVMTTGLWSFID